MQEGAQVGNAVNPPRQIGDGPVFAGPTSQEQKVLDGICSEAWRISTMLGNLSERLDSVLQRLDGRNLPTGSDEEQAHKDGGVLGDIQAAQAKQEMAVKELLSKVEQLERL